MALKLVYFITSSIVASDFEVGLDSGKIIGLKSSSLRDISLKISGVNNPP